MRNEFVYLECDRNAVAYPDIEVTAQPYYGQCAEDLIVVSLVRSLVLREGLSLSNEKYLEIGANHPIATSATYLLRQNLGMRGVLIEPNPRLLDALTTLRSDDVVVHCAVTAGPVREVDLFISNHSEISSLSRRFVEDWNDGNVGLREVLSVPGLGINDILAMHFAERAPLFLSLDIEGIDFEVLREMDFERWRPAFLQIEPSDFFITGNSQSIASFMSAKDYVLLAQTDVNLIFTDIKRMVPISSFDLDAKFERILGEKVVEPLTAGFSTQTAKALVPLLEQLQAVQSMVAAQERRLVDVAVRAARFTTNLSAVLRHPLSSSARRAYRLVRNRRIAALPPLVGYVPDSVRAGLVSRLLAVLSHPGDKAKRRTFRRSHFAERLDQAPCKTLYMVLAFWVGAAVLGALSRLPLLPESPRRRFARSAGKRRTRLAYELRPERPTMGEPVQACRLYERRAFPLLLAASQASPPKICVVVHAHYLETAAELLTRLRNIAVPFDLFMTTPQARVQEAEGVVARVLPGVKCRIVAATNKGRNFGPMLVELSQEIKTYELLLHLHTKKSLRTGREQDDWRRHIVDHLIGTTSVVNGVLEAFRIEPRLGLVGPVTFSEMPYWCHHWLSNKNRAENFFPRIGINQYPRIGFLDFPVGGMFWARVAALAPLWSVKWRYDDFDSEPAAADGTLAHVIERAIGVIAGATAHLYGETDLAAGTLWVGGGDKGLPAYFSHIMARLDTVRGFDTISFDFYDTLFTRLSVRPEDVQAVVGHVLKYERAIPDDTDFLLLRKQAEADARRVKRRGDVNLSEIYAAFPGLVPWSAEVISRAEELELEIEGRALIPRQPMLEFARELALQGKRLLVVSDTYMSSTFVRTVLAAHACDVFTEILVSSEIGLRKDTGTIWAWLKEREVGVGRRFIHVGDNEQSDLQKSADYGLQSFGLINAAVLADLRKCPMPPLWREAQSDWRDGILMGPLVARVGGRVFDSSPLQPFKFSTAREFGHAVLGPIALAFMAWLVQRAEVDHVDRLYFLSRGGYFLHELYKRLVTADPTLPQGSYLRVSRRAVLPAAFAVSRDVGPILKGVGGFKGTFGELLNARLGMAPEAASGDAGKQVFLPADSERIAALIMDHADIISDHCQSARKCLLAYLQQEGVNNAKNPALVDLGYSATIQKALQTAAARAFGGYYFAVTPSALEVESAGGFVGACFGAEQAGEVPPDIIKYSLLLEAFFVAPTGQVDGYAERDGCVEPVCVPTPESGAHYPELVAAAEGMMTYCEDLVHAYGPAILRANYDPELALAPLKAVFSGWGGVPEKLRPALLVDDAFCGNEMLDALAVLRTLFIQDQYSKSVEI